MEYQRTAAVLEWLQTHPWGWLLILLVAVIGFIAWASAPVTWHNSEGPLVSEERHSRLRWRLPWLP